MHRVDHYPARLAETLRSVSPEDPGRSTAVVLTPGPFNSYATISNLANSAAAVLPSFVDPDDAILYGEACLGTTYPIFVGYEQSDADQLWYAEAQSVPVQPDTGNYSVVALPVVCPQAPAFAPTPWPTPRCAALNVLNLAYNQTFPKVDTDGTYLFASKPSEGYTYTPTASASLQVLNATSLWIWYRGAAPTVSVPCSSILGSITPLVQSPLDNLVAYTCAPSPLHPTVTINYGGGTVGEVMLFQSAQAGMAIACVFVPCF